MRIKCKPKRSKRQIITEYGPKNVTRKKELNVREKLMVRSPLNNRFNLRYKVMDNNFPIGLHTI
jgi:hypothetical protein